MNRLKLYLHYLRLELRYIWIRATTDPDLIWIAPMIIVMGLILPWLFRLLAWVIGPVMWLWGGMLLVVAVWQKVSGYLPKKSKN
jgi:hypothetical protein